MTCYNKKVFYAFLIVLIQGITGAYCQEKAFSVFYTYQDEDKTWMKYTDLSNALYHHVSSLAIKCLEGHDQKIASFKTPEAWNSYIKNIREQCFSSLSQYAKTPLHVQTTGILERSNFKAEKIVFESIPGFYVTGCLFIPTNGKKPFPAVLVAIGHSQTSFRRDLYQHEILNLVSKGFVVFTYDPLGQGERIQYFEKEKNKSIIGAGVPEHSYAGAQSLLLGHSISDHFIWDGVRALDFLCSRSEVDTARIGMTGISGGGTQTAFLSAFDKRIKAAAPVCFVTSFQRIFESIGPQDAEQNAYHGLKKGIDHVDLLLMRAPRPAMVVTTTEDFFSIQGARETVAKAKKCYQIFGKEDNLTMVEATGSHGSEKDNREKMYRFFRQYLNNPGSTEDEKIPYFTEEELKITSTGQVSTDFPDHKTIFDLNCEEAAQILNKRTIKKAADLQKNRSFLLNKIREISGYDTTRSIQSVVFTGKILQPSYTIEKYFIEGRNFEYPIPFVIIKPTAETKGKTLLYLSSKGKEELLNNPREIQDYTDLGYTIIAPDMIGTGELKNTSFTGDSNLGISYNILFSANLAGKSLAGIQASDLNMLFRALDRRKDVDLKNVVSVVKDEVCSTYLHFAVFNKTIKKTILLNPLVSYEDMIFSRKYDQKQMWTAVPGALPYYDIPFLESLLAPRELIIVDPVNAKSEIASADIVNKQTRLLLEGYASLNAINQIKITQKKPSGIMEYLKMNN